MERSDVVMDGVWTRDLRVREGLAGDETPPTAHGGDRAGLPGGGS